jgi:hypothetical protein
MDPSTHERGKELQNMMRLFKEATTSPLSTSILQIPLHKTAMQESNPPEQDSQPAKSPTPQRVQRQSPRLKSKLPKEKSITRLAQDLVDKKCGVLQEEESLDDMTLQRYLQLYKQPLLEDSMQAIVKLTDVAVDKQSKKPKDKKTKTEKSKKKCKKPMLEDLHLSKKMGKLGKVAPRGVKA